MDDIKKCNICGKPFVPMTNIIQGRKKTILVTDCNCSEEIYKEKQRAIQALEKKLALESKFKNSMITPYFKDKTFESLSQSTEVTKCKEYALKFNPRTSSGLRLIGNTGTGKTTLTACICNELIEKGYNCLFITMSVLLDKFIGSCNFESETSTDNLFRWLIQFDFIVIDDLGREKYTEKRLEFAFRIIDELMNNKVVTAFTANPEMIKKLKTIPDFEAILDRLYLVCSEEIIFKGESFRRTA